MEILSWVATHPAFSRIPYVNCFSHRLHLKIIDTIKLIDSAKVCLDQSNMIYKFSKLYMVKQMSQWDRRKRCIIWLDGDDIAMATGIHVWITKHQFIYTMLLMKEIPEFIKPGFKILQSREIGYVYAVPVIKTILSPFSKRLQDLKLKIYYKAKRFLTCPSHAHNFGARKFLSIPLDR